MDNSANKDNQVPVTSESPKLSEPLQGLVEEKIKSGEIPLNPLGNLSPKEPTVIKPPLPEIPLPQANLETSTQMAGAEAVEVRKSPFRFLIPVLGIIIVGLIVVFLISKFRKSDDLANEASVLNQEDKVSITYWGLWEPPVIMEEIIDQFESANPGIDVIYSQQSIKDYRQRLENSISEGAGPDVFRFHVTWSPLFKNDLDSVPDEVLTATDFENQQYPVAKDWLRFDNKYKGIPLMFEGLGLFYNKNVLEVAGKVPPKTWEELRRLSLELTIKNKEGQIQRSGVALGTTGNVDNWSDILGVLFLQNGANPAEPVGQLAEDALRFYTLFNTTDMVWDDSMPSSTIAFATEKVVMMVAPSWRAHEVRAMNPNLAFAIAELPQLPNTEISWASVWSDGVSAKSSQAKKEASWKFLTYLNQKETLRSWYALASKQRLFGEIFARKDMAEQLLTDPFVSAYLNQADYAKTWYLNSRTFDNGPNDKMIKYYEDAVNAVLKGETVTRSLSTAQAGISQIINQYRLPSK